MLDSIISFGLEHWTWLAGGGTTLLALLTPAGPLFAALKANPMKAVIGVAFVALAGWSIDRTIRVANLRAEIAQGEAKRAQAVIDQKERDRVLAGQLSAELAEENARVGGAVITRTEVIYREKPVYKDLDTPAMRQSDDGLRELGFRRATRSGAGGIVDAPAAPSDGAGETERR